MKSTLAVSVLTLVGVTGTFLPGMAPRDTQPAVVPGGGATAIGGQTHECIGKTIGFWGNPNGNALILAGHFLDVLPSLHVVDELGVPFTTHDIDEFNDWLHDANAVNMAYMLSAQLVAMQFNVLNGNVDVRCQVVKPGHSFMSIDRLIEQAVNALIQDPYTPPGDPNRARQEMLKDLLDDANNNLNWF